MVGEEGNGQIPGIAEVADNGNIDATSEVHHENGEVVFPHSNPSVTVNEIAIIEDDEDEPLALAQPRIRTDAVSDPAESERTTIPFDTIIENEVASMNNRSSIQTSQETVPRRGRPSKPRIFNFNKRKINYTDSIDTESGGDTDVENRDVAVLPKVHTNILYKLDRNDEWRCGYVHSRADKSTGRNTGCFNIQDDDSNSVQWYDFNRSEIAWEPVPEEILITTNDNEAINTAKLKELENWSKNNAYIEVPNTGQHIISTRWVLTTKEKGGSVSTKARLVARGFEDQEVDAQKVDSPTCSKETIRIALSIAASEKWKCNSLDVKAAFLQGNPLTRDIYVKPPKEAKTQNIWKLQKAVYGVNEASRHWYDRVKDTLIEMGFICCKYDEAFFIYRNDLNLQGFVSVHVDDFLPSGNRDFQGRIMMKMKEVFEIGTESSTPMKFLGININQDSKYQINLDQNDYVSSIEAAEFEHTRDKQRLLSKEEQYSFRAIVGQLNWISS